MAKNPERKNPETEKKDPILSERIRQVWIVRIMVGGILTLGAIVILKSGGADPKPYEMSDEEKRANDAASALYLTDANKAKGWKKASSGNVLPPDVEEKEGKLAFLEWPGKRRVRILKVDENGETSIEREEQEPQLFPINENCVAMTETFRRCINTNLHADPSLSYAWRSLAMQLTLRREMKAEKDDAVVAGVGGPHTTGECVIDVTPRDAVRDDIPYAVDENGRALFIGNMEDPDKAIEIGLKARGGLVGLHDLGMECGYEAGFAGGFCFVPRDPWHYQSLDSLKKKIETLEDKLEETTDPKEKAKIEAQIKYRKDAISCKRGDARWQANYDALEANPPGEEALGIKKTLNRIMRNKKILKAWEATKKTAKKAWEGTKKAGKKVKENVKDKWKKFKERRAKKKAEKKRRERELERMRKELERKRK